MLNIVLILSGRRPEGIAAILCSQHARSHVPYVICEQRVAYRIADLIWHSPTHSVPLTFSLFLLLLFLSLSCISLHLCACN